MTRQPTGRISRLLLVLHAHDAVRRANEATVEATNIVAQLRLRLMSAQAEIERCRREHTDMAGRNSALQTLNIRLAHQVEQQEVELQQLRHDLTLRTEGGGA